VFFILASHLALKDELVLQCLKLKLHMRRGKTVASGCNWFLYTDCWSNLGVAALISYVVSFNSVDFVAGVQHD